MLSDRDYVRNNGFRGSSHRGESSIIMPLIFANIAVFILQNLTVGETAAAEGITKYVTLDWGSIKSLEVWRLGTYMFAHGSFMHILVNMWGIWIFGRPLEYRIGPHRFLNLYLISGLVGGLIWLVFNSSPIYVFGDMKLYPRVLGASGALFGVMVAAAMVAPNLRYMLLIPPIPVRLKTLVAVYAAIEIFAVRSGQSSGGVAHLAHLGGLVGGYFYMVFNVPGSGSGITRGLQRTWSRLRSWFQRRSFSTTPPRSRNHDQQRQSRTENTDDLAETIDEILDKIGREGLSSLTPAERQKLEEARNRLKQNRGR